MNCNTTHYRANSSSVPGDPTNRADLLEPALAARPGRVDVAVEVGLPDADARRRLFALYGARVPLAVDEADVDLVVTRTDGMTASFVKELLRRAVLESLIRAATPTRPTEVIGADLAAALDNMLDSTQDVTRALLSGRPGGGRGAAGHGGFVASTPLSSTAVAYGPGSVGGGF